MSKNTVGFIGGGNMAEAIVAGLIAAGTPPDSLSIAEPVAARRHELAERYPGVAVTDSNSAVATRAGCLVLAVKPQVLGPVCVELGEIVQDAQPLIVSIAAGVRTGDIDTWLGGNLAIVRVMPNQPALLREGVSGLFANAATGAARRERARQIAAATGEVVEVASEADIDTVTAVSGSGPAYVYLLMDMLAAAAVEHGLDATTARTLAIGTARGAAALAAQSDESMDTLIARVRSPGGTTAAALDSLEGDQVRAIFSRAINAARERAAELADQAHKDY